MTTPLHSPIPRTYWVNFVTGERFRPPEEPVREDIPSPYCYHEMLSYESRDVLKEKFTKNLNSRRWHHIYTAEVKAKK
jgi:hypothetical protein